MSRLFPPGYQFTDASGNVVDSGQVFVYDNNTSTLSTVYTDAALSLPASNPTTLGTDGRMTSELFTNATHSIKVLDANNGVVPNYTRDDVTTSAQEGTYNQGDSNASNRTIKAKLQDVVSVKDFGALGDGSTDDYTAIQNALNYCETNKCALYVPGSATHYIITKPLLGVNNVVMFGDGASSVIENDGSNASANLHYCMFFGQHHPAQWSSYTTYACGNVSIGDAQVTTSTAADAGNFIVGRVVFIRSTGVLTADSTIPQVCRVNRVVTVNDSTGVVTFEYPFDVAITSPLITDGTGFTFQSHAPSKIVHHSGLKDIAFKAPVGINALGRTACYESFWEGIHILQSYGVIVGNAMAHSSFRRIKGYFDVRAVEVKNGAHDSVFDDIECRYVDTSQSLPGTMLSTGEQNASCTFNNIRIHAGGWDGDGCVQLDGRGHKLTNSHFYIPDVTGKAIAWGEIADLESYQRNSIENCNFEMGTPSFFIRYGVSASLTYLPFENTVTGCRFYGAPSSDAVQAVSGTNNTLTNNYFQDGNLAYSNSAFSDNIIEGNTMGSGPSGAASLRLVNWHRHNRRQDMEGVYKARLLSIANEQDSGVASNTVQATFAWPTGTTVQTGDRIRVRILGAVSGTNSTKSVEIYDSTNSQSYGTLSLVSADTGDFAIEGEFIWQGNTILLGRFQAHFDASAGTDEHVTDSVRQTGMDVATDGIDLEIRYSIAHASDSIFWQRIEMWPELVGDTVA